MPQHHYFYYFLGNGYIIDLEAKDKFYIYIKDLFFIIEKSEWNKLKYIKFVEKHKLDFPQCYSLLNEFYNIYIVGKTGQKGFKSFL